MGEERLGCFVTEANVRTELIATHCRLVWAPPGLGWRRMPPTGTGTSQHTPLPSAPLCAPPQCPLKAAQEAGNGRAKLCLDRVWGVQHPPAHAAVLKVGASRLLSNSAPCNNSHHNMQPASAVPEVHAAIASLAGCACA